MTNRSLLLEIYFEDKFTDQEKIINFIKEKVTGIYSIRILEE